MPPEENLKQTQMLAKIPSQLRKTFGNMHIKKSEDDKSDDALICRGPTAGSPTWSADGDQPRKYRKPDSLLDQPGNTQESLSITVDNQLYDINQLEEPSQSYGSNLLEKPSQPYDGNPLEELSQPYDSDIMEETSFITDNDSFKLLSDIWQTDIFDMFSYGDILSGAFVPETPPDSMEEELICIPARESPDVYIPPVTILPPLPSPPVNSRPVQPLAVSDRTYSYPSQLDPVQHNDNLKAYRYVAGLSREALLQADEEGDTLLHLAIVKEEQSLVNALIVRYDRDQLMNEVINLGNTSNQTPLCMAVYSNQPEIVAKLISRGADVNVQILSSAPSGTSAKHVYYHLLHYAASRGHEWMATLCELLKATNINLDAINSYGCAPIHVAIEAHGKLNSKKTLIDSKFVIHQLADRGASLNKQDGLSGKTPLHYIIEKKNPELISWYLDMADSFYQKQFSFEQQSQLDRSIIRYPSVHEILNTRMSSGNTCLHLALGLAMERREKEKILELLIKSGAQLTNKTTDGRLKRTLMKIPSVANLLKSTSGTASNRSNRTSASISGLQQM